MNQDQQERGHYLGQPRQRGSIFPDPSFQGYGQEAGIFDEATARRFRKEILEVGGSRDILEAYVAFRGREPTIDALLHQHGIETE